MAQHASDNAPTPIQPVKKMIQSSIEKLSVGDERKCFNQIRKAAEWITPDSLLWNGWPAGEFALAYVIGHHQKRKQKAESKGANSSQQTKIIKAMKDLDALETEDAALKKKAKDTADSSSSTPAAVTKDAGPQTKAPKTQPKKRAKENGVVQPDAQNEAKEEPPTKKTKVTKKGKEAAVK